MILSDSKIYEKTLIMRLTQDDEEAFGEIYTRYKKRIYYFAFKFVKSKELAEDICHDVFVALWENRRSIDPELSFSSFFFTITRNRILYVMRIFEHEERLKDGVFSQAIDYEENTERLLLAHELTAVIAIARGKMTERQRQVFEMSRERGMSHKEIARELGLSIYSVQEHVSNALQVLRRTIQKNYGDSV